MGNTVVSLAKNLVTDYAGIMIAYQQKKCDASGRKNITGSAAIASPNNIIRVDDDSDRNPRPGPAWKVPGLASEVFCPDLETAIWFSSVILLIAIIYRAKLPQKVTPKVIERYIYLTKVRAECRRRAEKSMYLEKWSVVFRFHH